MYSFHGEQQSRHKYSGHINNNGWDEIKSMSVKGTTQRHLSIASIVTPRQHHAAATTSMATKTKQQRQTVTLVYIHI